ncbi:MAG TPA: PEGA domain-containing protein, partial [Vicinamibacteria bacterium]|nr:PEGA domain-containing protein [Vicinamibacteria bacterium]
ANRTAILAVTAALAFAGPAPGAQASRRGGHPGGGVRPGGGGHGGGSYAVPRGSGPARPGYVPHGGVAAARRPRAGPGSYFYPGHGGHYPPYYNGRHGYYYHPYYYGYYRPYYPYFSFSFGWPYYYWGWGPYGYYSPTYSISYYGYPDRAWDVPPAGDSGRPSDSDRAYAAPPPFDPSRDEGRVRLEVRPEDASVYVDDEFRGTARDTKFLTLRSGRHTIELVRPGFEVARRDVDVARGETSDVLVELKRP